MSEDSLSRQSVRLNDSQSRIKYNCVAERRLGRFTISTNVIDTSPEIVMLCLSKVVVVRAEMMFAEQYVEYTGFSPLFDKLAIGALIPLYELVVSRDFGPNQTVDLYAKLRVEYSDAPPEATRLIRIRPPKEE